ncbi:MAG: tetratricopeptide repeat protein, partial [Patescibacteria group bacterium]
GFLGILAYLIIIGLFLIIIWIMAKADTVAADGDNYILPLSLVFLALVVSQLFYYQNTVLAFVFWLILGLSLSRWQKNFGALEYSFKEFPEIGLVLNVVFIMVLIGFAGMCIFGARFYIADSVYAKAFLAEDETTQISYLEKAASLNPYRIQYKILLSRLYLAKVLREAGKSDAEQDMGKLSCDFSLAIAYARGLTMSKICVFPDASAEEQITIKGAVQISPNSAAALENLGIIYREVRLFTQGANELAIEAFSKAIELDPANPVLYTELGKLLLAGKLDDAKKNFDKAAELKPNYPDAVIQQALLLEGEGSLNDAVTKLENLAASNPFDAEVLFQLGRMYYNNNRADEATSILQRVVFLFPNYSNAHYVLGIIYSSKGEKDSAIAEFEKVLELNPGNQDVIDKINSLKD